MKSLEDTMFCLSLLHAHCETCINIKCTITPDQLSSCEIIECHNGCGHRFHSCKSDEHELICSQQKVPCINHAYGCPLKMTRRKRASHLNVCPASVQRCLVEWNRRPMYSPKDCIGMPLRLDTHHVKCTQLDVALALRDQRMLVQSMKVLKKVREIFQNLLAQKYPSVPLEQNSHPSVDSDMTIDDTSGPTSDVITPWGIHIHPQGLEKTLVNQLNKASKEFADSATAALVLCSHHFGKAWSKQTANIYWCKHLAQKLTNIKETEEIKLYNLLGVSFDIEYVYKYKVKGVNKPKPKKVYTFHCTQDFRRDEYPWHFKNVHIDIHCGLNGMMELRCPLAYMGCTFSCRRLSPLIPKGKIVHSSLQESFGLVLDSDNETIEEPEAQCKNCSKMEFDKRKLREATPEITTSQKFDSKIKILPTNWCNTLCYGVNSQPTSQNDIHLQCLPFEVLQYISLFLDSFSLCNLSLTCKLLRDVCGSLLNQKGMVVPVWQVKSNGTKASWSIAYWKWCFSSSFTPVKKWEYSVGNSLFEHLKMCPYNQENSKNIKTDPYDVMWQKQKQKTKIFLKKWKNSASFTI